MRRGFLYLRKGLSRRERFLGSALPCLLILLCWLLYYDFTWRVLRNKFIGVYLILRECMVCDAGEWRLTHLGYYRHAYGRGHTVVGEAGNGDRHASRASLNQEH